MWCPSRLLDAVLNLLLFLSALLTGFTGAIAGGQRTDAPAVQQSVAQVREIVAEAVVQSPASRPQRMPAVRSPIMSERIVQNFWALQIAPAAPAIGQVNEKRLI